MKEEIVIYPKNYKQHKKLTIMDLATREYWQSDNVQDLYPNQKGRG